MIESCATIYTGLPNSILVDQGRNLGDLFVYIAAISNVKVESTGIEAHDSLGIGERYHPPMLQTFRKVKLDYLQADRDLVLRLSVKAMNGTLGPEGLVPSALVLAEFSKIFTRYETPRARFALANRPKIPRAARTEMQKHMAKMRVIRALKHPVPSAIDRIYEPGDQVLIWRERQVNNRIFECIGPFSVEFADESKQLVYVRATKIGNARPFNVAQVKLYYPPEGIAHASSSRCANASVGTVIRTITSDLSEIIDDKDPRSKSPEISAAKRAEVAGLLPVVLSKSSSAKRFLPTATCSPVALF